MSKIRGTSNVPMMLGIIGGVLGLPAALCTGACAACVGAVGSAGAALAVTDPNSGITEADATAMTAAAGSAATILMAIAIAGSLAGLIGGLLGKKAPALAGVIMILSALFNAAMIISGNFISPIAGLLFLIGGAVCFSQKKEAV